MKTHPQLTYTKHILTNSSFDWWSVPAVKIIVTCSWKEKLPSLKITI